MVKVRSDSKWGVVKIHVDHKSIPVLKLLKWHAPAFRVECFEDRTDRLVLIPLSMLDLDTLVCHEENTDRAQLSKLSALPAAAKR